MNEGKVTMIDAVKLALAFGAPLDQANMREDIDEANSRSTCYGEAFVLLQAYAANRAAKLRKG